MIAASICPASTCAARSFEETSRRFSTTSGYAAPNARAYPGTTLNAAHDESDRRFAGIAECGRLRVFGSSVKGCQDRLRIRVKPLARSLDLLVLLVHFIALLITRVRWHDRAVAINHQPTSPLEKSMDQG